MQNDVKLRYQAPVIYWVLWAMVLTNALYAVALFNFHPTIPYPVVENLFDFRVWSGLFMLLSIVGGVSLLTDNYRFIRQAIFLGLFVKSFWFIALVLRSLSNGTTLTITATWLFIEANQVIIAMYFPEK